MSKKIIAVVGMAGSGKSTVVEALVSKYRLPYIYFGNITMQEIERRGLESNQTNEKAVRQELREKYGMAAYAQLSLPQIQKDLETHQAMLIDGLYSWSEYVLLEKAQVGEIHMISVISRRKTRYARLASRGHRSLSPEEARKRDFAEIEALEKGGPIALCDYYLTNDGTVEELTEAVYNLAEELGLESKDNR